MKKNKWEEKQKLYSSKTLQTEGNTKACLWKWLNDPNR